MRPINYFFIAFLSILSLGSCKKYLAVQPEGQYTNPQVYTNENAVQQALNGLYNNLGTDSLYGAALTTTTVELLAQQWYTASSQYTDIENFDYTSTVVEPAFENIWQVAYADILAANVFLQGIDGAITGGVVSAVHGKEMKGEAIAIRAMLHLDLLRLFGPVMSTGAGSPAIPYYRRPDGKTQPILTGTQALDSVLADLTQADSLLVADPVVTTGPSVGAYGVSPDFYAGDRNQRLNYYAVKALMARAYLYGGLTMPAHDSALAVLKAVSQWFPWLPYTDITGNPTDPNRIFSTEVLFGVYNPEMYTNYNSLFLPTLPSTSILEAIPATLSGVFENNENDYRYLSTWEEGPQGNMNFYKYAQLTDNTNWQFIQPVIRKSELFYIVAETDPDQSVGFAYLDSVRYNRGLPNLDPTAVLVTEIQKEYQKEFIGEGQLFYYYKRQNVSSLPLASGYYPYTITPVYQVPLPLSETTLR